MLTNNRISRIRVFGLGLLVAAVLLATTDGAFAFFRFAMMADSRGNPPSGINEAVLSQLITDMNAHNPDFCLFPGDNVKGYSTSTVLADQLDNWIAATSHFTGTMYVTPGNHDINEPGHLAVWQSKFPTMPQNGPDGEKGVTYYFDHGNSRFISITSDWEDEHVGVNQAWLDGMLDASTAFQHVFVTTHHPHAGGWGGDLGGKDAPFWQSLVTHGVDASFCGHMHKYEPSQPCGTNTTWDVIVGTAGAPLDAGQKYGYLIVDVNGAYAEARFYVDSDGDGHYDDLGDSFVIATPELDTYTFRQNVNGYNGVLDTYIGNGVAGVTGPNDDNSATTNIRIDGNEDNEQGLLRFDDFIGTGPGQIAPGTQIFSATLTFTTEGSYADSPDGARFHRMLIDWQDSDTWNDFIDGIAADGVEALADYDLDTGAIDFGTRAFDVTESVQAWLDGEANYGWVIIANGDNRWEFRSSEFGTLDDRPLLTIAVVPEPATMVLLGIGGISVLVRRKRH